MIVASGIIFHHYRNENMLDTVTGEFSSASSDMGELDIVAIKQIIVSKEAQKEYIAYGNQKSYYLPTGMVGPTVKLLCHVHDHDKWKTVFTNDYLKIITFEFPTWNVALPANSTWWVDSISLDSQPGFIHNGRLRYEMTLDLYKRTV
jgi:hypothetical protein